MPPNDAISAGNTALAKHPRRSDNAIRRHTSIARHETRACAFSYDTANRLTGLTYTSNAGADSIDAFGWGFNAADLVTSFTSIDGTASYAYAPTNQLTSATYTTASGGHQPANESCSFDKPATGR